MEPFNAARASIDQMFEDLSVGAEPATDRILEYAKRGIEAPEALSHKELQQVCHALVIHYAQMGAK